MRKTTLFSVAVLAVALLLGPAGLARGDDFYVDDFEGYAVGEMPVAWEDLSPPADAAVTDAWAASPTKSLVSASYLGAPVKHPVLDLASIGAWPLPDYFAYEATIHMEETAVSSGALGFFYVDPRYAGHVVAGNAVVFRLDGKVMWYGPVSSEIGSWTPGTATTAAVRVEIDFPHQVADVWIDTVLVAEDIPAWPKTIPAESVYGEEVPLAKWGFSLSDNTIAGEPARVFVDDVTLSSFAMPIVGADIKIYPRTLNLKSHGRFMTCFIELPSPYDAHAIDISTVYISTPGCPDRVYAHRWPVHVRDRDRDGLWEMMCKFPRQDVQALLGPDPAAVLTVSGELCDMTLWSGSDTVRAICPGKCFHERCRHRKEKGYVGNSPNP